MNHPQHSFARLSLGAFAKGGSGVPPFSAPATIIHHQHQMYGSSRGGEPRGACSIHAPVVDHKSQQGRVHSVPVCMSAFGFSSTAGAVSLPLTGRERHSFRPLFQHVAQCAFQGLAERSPSHSKASVRYVPNLERGQINAVHENHKFGATHDR